MAKIVELGNLIATFKSDFITLSDFDAAPNCSQTVFFLLKTKAKTYTFKCVLVSQKERLGQK